MATRTVTAYVEKGGKVFKIPASKSFGVSNEDLYGSHLNIHQRILNTYKQREASGELRNSVWLKKFRDAHIAAQEPGYWNRQHGN